MRIDPLPPFEIHPEPDGTQHATKDNIQITVLPDVGEIKMFHRNALHQSSGGHTRWLVIKAGDLNIFVHGTHVVVTKNDLYPTIND